MQVLVYEVHVRILTCSCTQKILHLHFIINNVVHMYILFVTVGYRYKQERLRPNCMLLHSSLTRWVFTRGEGGSGGISIH